MQELLNKIESEITSRGIDEDQIADILKNNKDIINRRIIYGYASVDCIDREGQRIPILALKDAVKNFMKNIYLRNLNIFHSDISIGRILPKWTNPETGETLVTEVDQIGWRCIAEIRDDIEVANKVWDEILKGNIRSFSVAGSSQEKLRKRESGIEYEQVNELQFVEVTCCETPVNQLAKFEVLFNPDKIQV